MAASAADGFFRGVYEGCISGHDNDVQRRPYHRNCGCAIHDKSSSSSSSPKAACTHRGKSNNVSYPLRRAWSESCLAMAAYNNSAHSSPSSSPATATTLGNCRPHHHKMGLTDLEEED
ncbi:uncharacterized protein LOC114735618 [Neltuma alba]|uniref:uncharacterized protein LOC114719486 n=1 Tax=Neltuma alba TaxID=207710 RepID=UPI0010A4C35E|nr:uncharacterized protein LOC114719486 [Prosopis alba]XP_028779150.1 uncharacterized protein LOC114735618 [Prosopis alba]